MAFLSLAASTSAQGLDAHFASLQTFLMDDADVLLEFVGRDDARTLPAHSQILKIGCSVLREVLKTCKRNSQGLLILPLVDDCIDAWKLLLVFMYGGLHSPPEITWATGRAVVPLAHKYDCQAVLHSHLMRLMQLPLSLYPQHASYAPDWYHLAECLKLEALRQRCRDYLFRCVSDEKVDILHLIQVSERLGLPELYVECLRSQRWLTGSLLCDRSGLLRLHPATLCDLLSFLGSREGAVAGSRGDGQSALRKKMQEAFVNDLEQQMSRIQASFSERRRPLPTP